MVAVVAVSALPVKAPTKAVDVTDVKPVMVVSTLTVTLPVAADTLTLVPPIRLATELAELANGKSPTKSFLVPAP